MLSSKQVRNCSCPSRACLYNAMELEFFITRCKIIFFLRYCNKSQLAYCIIINMAQRSDSASMVAVLALLFGVLASVPTSLSLSHTHTYKHILLKFLCCSSLLEAAPYIVRRIYIDNWFPYLEIFMAFMIITSLISYVLNSPNITGGPAQIRKSI